MGRLSRWDFTMRQERARHFGDGRTRGAHSRGAFTLVELVMVLSIVGVLSAIAVPRVQRSIARQRADAAANRIANDLRYARKRAIQQSASQSLVFVRSAGNDSYGMAGVAGLDNPSAAYRVSLSGEPYLATLASVSFGGKLSVAFDGFGMPDSGGTVVVQVGEFVKTITVDGTTGEPAILP